MENKKVIKKLKAPAKSKSVRIGVRTFEKADRWVNLANEKKVGSKIKIDQVLNLALDLLTSEHVKKLQTESLKGSDLQGIMRQKYIRQYGNISKEEYIAFTTTSAYADFLVAQKSAGILEVAG